MRSSDWSVRKRLTLIASVVMSLFCVGACALILLALRDLAISSKLDRLLQDSLFVIPAIAEGRLSDTLPLDWNQHGQVIDPQGRIVSTSPDMRGAPKMSRLLDDSDYVRESEATCDSPAFPSRCVIITAFRVYRPEGPWEIYVAADTVPWYIDSEVAAQLAVGSLLLIGLTAAGTYRIVAKTLAPVEAIRAELAEIKASDLGRRVPVPGTRDEIRKLAETVNQTLDRLEQTVQLQRRFASDASHDLRSPLTAMRAQVEDALLHPEETDWIAMSHAQLESLNRLEALVSDLLTLAKLDAGAVGKHERLDLSALVSSELDRRPRRVRVDRRLKSGVYVNGDRLRLARLLTNLMDNAERHANERITVTVTAEDGRAILEVLDDGTGIPPDQREFVFQRFTRLDAARSKDAGGTGLGLPIAREVAQQHGGTLTVEDSDVGARLVARLPLASYQKASGDIPG